MRQYLSIVAWVIYNFAAKLPRLGETVKLDILALFSRNW